MCFLSTTEKLNATPEVLERYQDLLEHELNLVKELRRKMEPTIHVHIMGIAKTAKVSDLLGLIRNCLLSGSLAESKELLDKIRAGKKPVVTLRVPLNHYTLKQHPLAEGFILRIAD